MLTSPEFVDPAALRPDELFRDCEDENGILIGVSGGPDSMALLRLLVQWTRTPGRPPIHAATVDHGMRPESAIEARSVAKWCEKLAVPHFILPWTGPKPKTRIQERARMARYERLDACAISVGASVLITAHHADDQYETILLRLQRGSGIGGLAGMAHRTHRGSLAHVRPLLQIPKSSLLAFCASIGQEFFDDPSNADPQFARARLRADRAALTAHGLDPANLQRLAGRAARAEAALQAASAELTEKALLAREFQVSSFRRDILARAPQELVLRVLLSECTKVSGRIAPRLEQTENLTSSLYPLLAAGFFRRPLGGTMFTLAGDRLELRREIRSRERRLLHARDAEGAEEPCAASLVKGEQGA